MLHCLKDFSEMLAQGKLRTGIAGTVAAAVLIFGFVQPALSAVTIVDHETVSFDQTNVGMFDVTYQCTAGDLGCADDVSISGYSWWTIDSLSDDTAIFTISLENNTIDPTNPGARLVSWGVKVITSEVFTAVVTDDTAGGGDWTAVLDTTFPAFDRVDLCLFGGENCTGGSTAGLLKGDTDTVQLTLTGDFSGTTTFNVFPSKWQSVGVGGVSLEIAGTVDSTDGSTGGSSGSGDPFDVPEPATLLMLGLGLLGFAFCRRRTTA